MSGSKGKEVQQSAEIESPMLVDAAWKLIHRRCIDAWGAASEGDYDQVTEILANKKTNEALSGMNDPEISAAWVELKSSQSITITETNNPFVAAAHRDLEIATAFVKFAQAISAYLVRKDLYKPGAYRQMTLEGAGISEWLASKAWPLSQEESDTQVPGFKPGNKLGEPFFAEKEEALE